MKLKTFQARVVARLRRALKRGKVPLARLRDTSLEALRVCGRHGARVPDRVAAAFERRHENLWKSPEKRAIV